MFVTNNRIYQEKKKKGVLMKGCQSQESSTKDGQNSSVSSERSSKLRTPDGRLKNTLVKETRKDSEYIR